MLKLESINRKIQCPKCRGGISLDLTAVDRPETSAVERALGPEVEYSWTIPVVCPHCGHKRSPIIVDAYEYPPGFMNWVDVGGDEWKDAGMADQVIITVEPVPGDDQEPIGPTRMQDQEWVVRTCDSRKNTGTTNDGPWVYVWGYRAETTDVTTHRVQVYMGGFDTEEQALADWVAYAKLNGLNYTVKYPLTSESE